MLTRTDFETILKNLRIYLKPKSIALNIIKERILNNSLFYGGLSGTKLTLLSKEIIEVCKEKNNIIFFEVLQNWLAA